MVVFHNNLLDYFSNVVLYVKKNKNLLGWKNENATIHNALNELCINNQVLHTWKNIQVTYYGGHWREKNTIEKRFHIMWKS
jgi:hypothetical protein